jgi:hypothetical protein
MRQLGERFRRDQEKIPFDEIKVAVDLVMPEVTGGICFLLQQPANNHPYHLGANTVISSSPTLRALTEVWSVVTRGSQKPSIFDRLPFCPPKHKILPGSKTKLEAHSYSIICAKRPEVVVCMSQHRRDEDAGNYVGLDSVGVGQEFARRTHDLGPNLTIQRVNAFHPSYAVNYNAHKSCFRQLLILEVSQACGIYAGEWTNETWMDDLRLQCRNQAKIWMNGKM